MCVCVCVCRHRVCVSCIHCVDASINFRLCGDIKGKSKMTEKDSLYQKYIEQKKIIETLSETIIKQDKWINKLMITNKQLRIHRGANVCTH